MSVCIVCSAGGHLSEALAATEKLSGERYYVTFDEPHVRERLKGEEVYYVVDPHVSPILYMKNAFQSLLLFIRKRPRVVISNGAGIALATCVYAKLAGAKLIFIETGARVTTPSRTGKLVYRFADLFIVQWRPLLKHYPKAVYGGPLL
ncbi:MAG TPA: UDP-N-acetylglucosamine--LPS N-acetylglucosamine transferase [Gammaproteobacteria bacterium]|nr:UDP-N-acetylglucosamine--LPS N-acetylglucosamine transferase [Gammaproteobacteria bacterium]